MKLFVPIVDKSLWHPNFASVLTPLHKAECDVVEGWASGFVDRDGKFVREFQTTFNSSFWEIYLYALFKSYGIEVDWSKSRPDFCASKGDKSFIVEATTANAAQGMPNEWDREFSSEELGRLTRFTPMNTEAMIRLSNAIHVKARKYEDSYRKLAHVQGKPFVIAVAPFEQPHFILLHDRPIRALLYDEYVDEDAYIAHPKRFPNGPPSVSLRRVFKQNGSPIELGLFNDASLASVSAVVYSCTATWGKLATQSHNPMCEVFVASVWASSPNGAPQRRFQKRSEQNEGIHDGLQVYHNPYATHPLAPDVFRRPGVVQHYYVPSSDSWIYESINNALLTRQVHLMARVTPPDLPQP